MGQALDLTRQRFGKLIAKEKTDARDAGGNIIWACECDCGKSCVASSAALRSGKKKSCGCNRKHDLTGKRFGKLMVINLAPNKGEKVAWNCKCDCGKNTIVITDYLLSGVTKSCGCLRIKHGGVGTKLYLVWRGLKNRCSNSNLPSWNHYGGRGISVCKEWDNSFSIFRDWAMQNGYSKNLQIDRKNNDGNYCPENCRFVTSAVNMRNRSGSKLTKEKASEIKKLLKATAISNSNLAEKYCVSIATINDIKKSRTWRDAPCF